MISSEGGRTLSDEDEQATARSRLFSSTSLSRARSLLIVLLVLGLVGFIVAERVSLTRLVVGVVMVTLLASSSRRWPGPRGLHIPAIAVFGSLLGVALLIRLPSILWAATVGWDEHTFLTVASQALQGGLPYVATFDNKGPVSVLFNAVPLAIAPTSLSGVRIALALIVGLSAFLITRTAIALGAMTSDAMLAGGVFIILASFVSTGAMWHTAHTGNLLVSALLLNIATEGERRRYGLGVLLALLVLTRANYLFTAVAVVPVWLLTMPRHQRTTAVIQVCSGGVFTAAVFSAPYALTGNLGRLWAGLVTVNLQQGHGTTGFTALPNMSTILLIYFAALWLTLRASRANEDLRISGLWRMTLVNAAAAFGTTVSISLSERVYDHHLLLLIIFPALQVGIAMARIGMPKEGRGLRSGRVPLALDATVMLSIVLAVSLNIVTLSAFRLDSARPSVERDLAGLVEEALGDEEGTVWALSDHHVYWRLGVAPIDPLVTHPSSIAKPGFLAASPHRNGPAASTSEAVMRILASRPTVIVGASSFSHSYLDQDSRDRILEAIDRGYVLQGHVVGRSVWRIADAP